MHFTCKVINGEIPLAESLKLADFLRNNTGKNIRYEVLNADLRSNKLNAYYWGIFLPTICDYWLKQNGENVSNDWINELLKKEFCYYKKDGVKHVISTKQMNTAQMLGFFKIVDLWCVEQFGKGIKKPNDIEEWNDSFR